MQNKGTDYIRRILRDKARQKRWRQIMLCLSCIVVFCTIYVLILPAITLEKKTTCEEEQSAIQEEQPLVQEEEESIVQSTIQSDDSEDIEFVSCEPIEEENDDIEDVEITEEPEEEMDVDFASGEEDAIVAVADEAVASEAGAADGFDLSANPNKINDVKLSYKLSDSGTWQECKPDNDTVIPANAKIKLQVEYKDIQISNLMENYSCKLTYNLPELLRNITTEGAIFDENQNKVGTVTSENRKITVTFDENYLNGLKNNSRTTINGNFYAQGDVNLSQVPKTDGKTTVAAGNKTYHLNFEPDAVAKYGQISVDKTCTSSQVISTANGDYLAYTITVTAGEDGCPDVSVVDTIVSSSDCVDSYAGIDTAAKTLTASQNGQEPYETIAADKNHGTVYLGNPDSANPVPTPGAVNITTAPGSMVWKIGKMEPGESRTLTYYVKLKDKVPLNGKNIQNKADVYSKIYKRVSDEKTFVPTIGYNMWKKREGDIVRNEDGSYTIKYKIYFDLTSNYPLKDFEFLDYLDDQSDNAHTDSKALPYISYDRESVGLYVKKDGESNHTPVSKTDYAVSWAKGNDTYETHWADLKGNPTRFKITGADGKPITVNPGDSYYATYTVTVKPEALAAMKSDRVEVKNRYYVNTSNASKKWNYGLDRVYANETVGNYTWDKKVVGTGTTSDQTISMSGDKYEYKSSIKPEKINSQTDISFTVPAGSYPYTVDVNQTLGDWDATEVSMTDTLSSDKMNYIGYAKVEACEYNATTKIYDVKDTKWVKIDGLRSFTLKPSDLGWAGVNYAYKFTYYARPADSNFGEVKVTNTFSLSGNAIRGQNSLPLGGISSQGEVTVSGSFKMNVKKESWYYEEPKTDATTWQNGKLYWVIEVSGTAILQGTGFRDAILNGNDLKDSYLHSDSLEGIYIGTLPGGKMITGYSSLEELKASGGLTDAKDKFTAPVLGKSKNFEGTDNYSELTVQAKERITLENNKLYFIIRTEPRELPAAYRDAFKFGNSIDTCENGTDWVQKSNANKTLYKGADILKELGQTFTYDGTTVTSKNDGADQGNNSRIVTTALPGAGQYAAWAFKVNYAGELSGSYRVLETIPNGMELAYMRIKWVGEKQDFGAMSSKKILEFKSDGWEEKTITAATDNGSEKKTIYYVKDNQALIELGDFTAGKLRDDYSVDVQVVCRVTDPDVLLGGIEKTFTNQVTLQTADGQAISTATSPATIEPQKKLDKQITGKKSEKITFTIEANPLGEVLPAENGTTLTLIDKLTSTLILDTGSIKVINSKTNEGVVYTASFDATANMLKIAIPCNVPVKITYDATVDVPPGQTVSFSNDAYWEKYSPAGGDSVKEENYSYAAGGTVSAGDNITLKIIKKDQNNLSSLLQGAEFKIIECKRESDGTITDVSGKEWNGTTNNTGEISFGSGSSTDSAMNYNTIYKVTETKAPSGYAVNSEPIYIMVPRKEENAADYSDYVKTCINDSQIHKQYKSIYELTVYNHKGEITVEKKFKDAGGDDSSPVSGTYTFGLYENPDVTNTTNSDGTTSDTTAKPLQTITITYMAGEKKPRTEKFVNLDLSKTYYVFELDDKGNPIKDSSTAATVNDMEYLTSYATTKTDSATGVNSAVSGNTVTVTNQTRVKELPSTGSYGPLIFRLAGAVLIFFAGLQMLINIKRRACNNR